MATMSPLRRRMIEDMTVRNLSPATQRSYLNAVSKFSRYFGRSPDRLGLDEVHAFQVHLVANGLSWPALNQIVCALRFFFYGVTLGQLTPRAALKLMAFLFPRPCELRAAEWSEFDLQAAIWSIPESRMKMRRPHRVPLSAQAIAVLKELHRVTGGGKLVVPSIRTVLRPISENTLNGALRRLGYAQDEATAHGFRATASTFLNESGKWNPDAIEHALAHVESNSVRRAYARGEHWDERVKMMAWWADYLDSLREGSNVVPLVRANRNTALTN